MRNPRALIRKHAPAYLLVGAGYAFIFLVAWLMTLVQLSPTQPVNAGHVYAPEERRISYGVGKLVVVGPKGCQYGEFSNRRAAAFAVTTADCSRVLKSLAPEDATDGHRVDRIEAIGRYFRGTGP